MSYSKKLNLTIGAFNFAFSKMFNEEDGQIRPALNTLQELLDTIGIFGNFEITLKTSEEDNVGLLTEDVYETGVLGMLHRKEVDVCFLPLPLDLSSPPGQYSPVIHDDAYHIYSFPQTTSSVTQDIATSLGTINLSLWLTMTVLVLILETINHLILQRLSNQNVCKVLIFSIYKTIGSSPATIYRQYLPGRSILRTVQIIGIMLFTCILGASFRTDSIVGNDEVKINTLKDVVQQDKKPFFIEGQSMTELFQKGVTSDYYRIYETAKKKGTSTPIPISSLDLITSFGSDMVYFCSNEIARAINKLSEAAKIDIAKKEYKSIKPFHRALAGFLVNPRKNSKEIKLRVKNLAIRQIQGDIFIQSLRRIINELLTNSALEVKSNQLFLDYRESEIHETNFEPLKFQGCKIVFITFGSALVISIFVHLTEICSDRLLKCTRPKCWLRSSCKDEC